MADTFNFPQYNVPFPYTSLPNQLQASFVPPNQQFSNASQYGRWNGVNNNAFGLFPNQFQSLFGSPTPPPMQFQPPYGNNGTLGSNQGPGSNPGGTPNPGMPPANKMATAGPGGDQAYTNQFYQGIANDPALMHLLQSGRGAAFGQALGIGSQPLSFTPQQVSQAMQNDPARAFQMIQQGGQGLENAVMQNNGMNQQQMNQFINNTGYYTPGAFSSGLLNGMRGG